MPTYANGRDTGVRMLGRSPGSGDVGSKTLSMAPPTVGGVQPSFYTENGMNVSRLVAAIRGSGGPSVSWTVRFGPTRNGLGTEVIVGGSTTDDEENGSSDILFTNSMIPANSFVWLEVTVVGGVVDELAITIIPELV